MKNKTNTLDSDQRARLQQLIAHLKQKEIANAVDSTPGHISRIANGLVSPGKSLLKRICIKYDLNEEWILYGTGVPNKGGSANSPELQEIINAAIKKWETISASEKYILAGKILSLLQEHP